MKINIGYYDSEALTVEEVVRFAQETYGPAATVNVTADSSAPHDTIYFALQQIITNRQLQLLFDNKDTYQTDIKILRAETLNKLAELLDSVIIDNESRVS